MVNKKLLRRTLAFIEANPEKHDQSLWCGTARCFAGWACHLDGWRRPDKDQIEKMEQAWGDDSNFDLPPYYLVVQESTAGDVEHVAASILGLDVEQADILFNPHNTRVSLRRIVDKLCSGDPVSYGDITREP